MGENLPAWEYCGLAFASLRVETWWANPGEWFQRAKTGDQWKNGQALARPFLRLEAVLVVPLVPALLRLNKQWHKVKLFSPVAFAALLTVSLRFDLVRLVWAGLALRDGWLKCHESLLKISKIKSYVKIPCTNVWSFTKHLIVYESWSVQTIPTNPVRCVALHCAEFVRMRSSNYVPKFWQWHPGDPKTFFYIFLYPCWLFCVYFNGNCHEKSHYFHENQINNIFGLIPR